MLMKSTTGLEAQWDIHLKTMSPIKKIVANNRYNSLLQKTSCIFCFLQSVKRRLNTFIQRPFSFALKLSFPLSYSLLLSLSLYISPISLKNLFSLTLYFSPLFVSLYSHFFSLTLTLQSFILLMLMFIFLVEVIL